MVFSPALTKNDQELLLHILLNHKKFIQRILKRIRLVQPKYAHETCACRLANREKCLIPLYAIGRCVSDNTSNNTKIAQLSALKVNESNEILTDILSNSDDGTRNTKRNPTRTLQYIYQSACIDNLNILDAQILCKLPVSIPLRFLTAQCVQASVKRSQATSRSILASMLKSRQLLLPQLKRIHSALEDVSGIFIQPHYREALRLFVLASPGSSRLRATNAQGFRVIIPCANLRWPKEPFSAECLVFTRTRTVIFVDLFMWNGEWLHKLPYASRWDKMSKLSLAGSLIHPIENLNESPLVSLDPTDCDGLTYRFKGLTKQRTVEWYAFQRVLKKKIYLLAHNWDDDKGSYTLAVRSTAGGFISLFQSNHLLQQTRRHKSPLRIDDNITFEYNILRIELNDQFELVSIERASEDKTLDIVLTIPHSTLDWL